MTGGVALIAGIVAALIAAVGSFGASWYLIRRQRSGRIDTSEAASLWKESTSLRTELRDRVAHLEAELTSLRVQNAAQATQIAGQAHRIAHLEEENERLRRRLDAATTA